MSKLCSEPFDLTLTTQTAHRLNGPRPCTRQNTYDICWNAGRWQPVHEAIPALIVGQMGRIPTSF